MIRFGSRFKFQSMFAGLDGAVIARGHDEDPALGRAATLRVEEDVAPVGMQRVAGDAERHVDDAGVALASARMPVRTSSQQAVLVASNGL